MKCHFCGDTLRTEEGTDDLFVEDVGEFYSNKLNDSVLAHPDCLPMGIDATLNGDDPEWVMA
jgi:hypothetical protein